VHPVEGLQRSPIFLLIFFFGHFSSLLLKLFVFYVFFFGIIVLFLFFYPTFTDLTFWPVSGPRPTLCSPAAFLTLSFFLGVYFTFLPAHPFRFKYATRFLDPGSLPRFSSICYSKMFPPSLPIGSPPPSYDSRPRSPSLLDGYTKVTRLVVTKVPPSFNSRYSSTPQSPVSNCCAPPSTLGSPPALTRPLQVSPKQHSYCLTLRRVSRVYHRSIRYFRGGFSKKLSSLTHFYPPLQYSRPLSHPPAENRGLMASTPSKTVPLYPPPIAFGRPIPISIPYDLA